MLMPKSTILEGILKTILTTSSTKKLSLKFKYYLNKNFNDILYIDASDLPLPLMSYLYHCLCVALNNSKNVLEEKLVLLLFNIYF